MCSREHESSCRKFWITLKPFISSFALLTPCRVAHPIPREERVCLNVRHYTKPHRERPSEEQPKEGRKKMQAIKKFQEATEKNVASEIIFPVVSRKIFTVLIPWVAAILPACGEWETAQGVSRHLHSFPRLLQNHPLSLLFWGLSTKISVVLSINYSFCM